MARLVFCADENVPRAFVTALESNGFTVVDAAEERGQETVDEALLQWATETDRVIVTNDRDFVELDTSHDHGGVIVYTDPGISPGEFARAIRRVDRQFTPESMENTLVWLDSWL